MFKLKTTVEITFGKSTNVLYLPLKKYRSEQHQNDLLFSVIFYKYDNFVLP